MAFALTDLFPDQDYRFHLTLRRGDLPRFFATRNPDAMRERARWLEANPTRYAAATPDAEDMVTELETLVPGWGSFPNEPASPASLLTRLARLGCALEPDFLLLNKGSDGIFTLRAGVVCFPSSWALEEKIGLTLESIHDVVPGLNPTLGPTIGSFLGKLKPGAPYERSNWGLAATSERNLHPTLSRPRLTAPFDPHRIWLRVEDQIVAALPATSGILFGIDIRVIPLLDALKDPRVRTGFHRALVTLPPALASYKGFSALLPELITFTAA